MERIAEKTNAMRLLDQRKVPYDVFEFSPEIHSAVEVAATIGLPAEQVYKTLVVMRERPGTRPLLVMIPAPRELNLKRVAAALGDKRARMATQREAESRTGLLVGGISALALTNKGFDVYLDESATSTSYRKDRKGPQRTQRLFCALRSTYYGSRITNYESRITDHVTRNTQHEELENRSDGILPEYDERIATKWPT